MLNLFDLRFLVVLGKGGVGRTSVSAALALAAARRGKRVLVALCNSKERLSHLLEVRPIGPRIVPILPRIDAVNMEPAAALEQYGMMILGVRALYKLVLGNRHVSAFLRGTPGLDAWALLGKAQYHVRQMDRTGQRPRYDLVILDAPATGHGLDMLRVPRVIVEASPQGLLRREAEDALELFVDPRRTGIALVTLAEELPTNETQEAYRELREKLGLSVCCLVVNRVLPKLFSKEERLFLTHLPDMGGDDAGLASFEIASRARAVREMVQEACIERLRESIPVPQAQLPEISAPEFRRAAIEALSRELDQSWARSH